MPLSDQVVAVSDVAYLRARSEEERDAAERSSCMVRDVHLEMAELYAARAHSDISVASGQTPADITG
jgi:hypothetical protein